MFDFIEWFIENRNQPLDYIFLAALVFIIDRFGRKFITSQVKRLFRVDDKSDFHHYVQNQRRIESKLELLLQKEGITWTAPISETKHQVSATRNAGSSVLQLAMYSIARAAGKFTNWRLKRMSNISKKILVPLLAAIALFVEQVWGFPIEDEYIELAAEVIMYIIMIVGIFMNPKKNKKAKKQKETANDTMDFTQDTAL